MQRLSPMLSHRTSSTIDAVRKAELFNKTVDVVRRLSTTFGPWSPVGSDPYLVLYALGRHLASPLNSSRKVEVF